MLPNIIMHNITLFDSRKLLKIEKIMGHKINRKSSSQYYHTLLSSYISLTNENNFFLVFVRNFVHSKLKCFTIMESII